MRQLLGQQDEEPQASTSQPGPRPQSGAALLPDVPPHVLEELVLYYFQSNSSNNQQQAPATPGKGPATTATPGGLRAAAASAAAAAANPFLALGSTLPLLQTRLQQPGTPQAPRPSSQGSSTLPSATQPRRKLQAPIFDTDDSTAFLNLLPRIVAQPKHAPVLPLAQTPAKLAAAGTPAAGQRSVGQGATRSKAALPLVSSQLMEDSDIMYPDISPVRRRQPAASFGTGQRASKQKPDDR